MQADNNWEDKVGKKLYDFEAELSPQSWNDISKKMQPKRRNRWFLWLPLVLALLSIPALLHYSGKLKTVLPGAQKPEENIAINSDKKNPAILNQTSKPSEKVAENGQKVTQPAENNFESETQKAENKITKSEVAPTPKEKEQIAINSNNTSEIKKPGTNTLVIIPGKSKKLPVGEENDKNEGSEDPKNSSRNGKPEINST